MAEKICLKLYVSVLDRYDGKMNDMSEQSQIDLNTLGCRVIDVHEAIQAALNDFSQANEDSLESLVDLIQERLGSVPVFVIGTPDSE